MTRTAAFRDCLWRESSAVEDKQTHMITHYSLYLQGGYPSPDANEHEELKENIPQVGPRDA